jgi:uncharacterized protein YehS (DUF1456 family)
VINNDILRAVRYMLDLSDPRVVEIIQLARADFPIDKAEVQALTRKEGELGFKECGDSTLAHFLDGLIVHLRGHDDSRPPRPVEKHMNNNVVLKKLRVAFELKDVDMHAIFESVDIQLGKPELNALFRDRTHKNFRACGDQLLRNFLRGLTLRLRPEMR